MSAVTGNTFLIKTANGRFDMLSVSRASLIPPPVTINSVTASASPFTYPYTAADVNGTSTTNGVNYKVYSFASVSTTTTYTVNYSCTSATTIYVLAVGGGGSGGGVSGGGGGGAGGVVMTPVSLSVGSSSITISIGAGGAALASSAATVGNNGGATTVNFTSNSSANIYAYGGGGGGYMSTVSLAGGSSGGNGYTCTASVVTTTTPINNSYNYANFGGGATGTGSGGGGGAGTAGLNGAATYISGPGGNGIQCSLPGVKDFAPSGTLYSTYYWGGGGGGAGSGSSSTTYPFQGYGGLGGGGAGGQANLVSVGGSGGINIGVNNAGSSGGNAGANTGSGGGGSWTGTSSSGAGGSGIVVIAFPTYTVSSNQSAVLPASIVSSGLYSATLNNASLSSAAYNSIKGAYANRLLNYNYFGPVMTLRHTLDTTGQYTQNFYSDICGNMGTGYLGTGLSLSNWLSANGANTTYAFVTKWYNQGMDASFNSATQYTTSKQPIYDVANGMINSGWTTGGTGGSLGIAAPQTGCLLSLPNYAFPYADSPFTVIFKHYNLASTTNAGFLNAGKNGQASTTAIQSQSSTSYFMYDPGYNWGTSVTYNNTVSLTYTGSNGTTSGFVNGTAATTSVIGTARGTLPTDNWIFGTQVNTTGNLPIEFLNGQLYSLYYFKTALSSADRLLVEATPYQFSQLPSMTLSLFSLTSTAFTFTWSAVSNATTYIAYINGSAYGAVTSGLAVTPGFSGPWQVNVYAYSATNNLLASNYKLVYPYPTPQLLLQSGNINTPNTISPVPIGSQIISSKNGQYLLAVSFNTGIYVSNNSGATFTTSATSATNANYTCMSDSGQYMYIGCLTTTNLIYASNNYGVSFSSSAVANLQGVCCSPDGLQVWYVTNNGILQYSNNYGVAFRTLTTVASSYSLFSVNYNANGNLVYFSSNTTSCAFYIYNMNSMTLTTYTYTNLGISNYPSYYVVSSCMSQNGTYIYLGLGTTNTSTILGVMSSNGGTSWSTFGSGTLSGQYGAISFLYCSSDGLNVYYLNNNITYYSSNYGSTWTSNNTYTWNTMSLNNYNVMILTATISTVNNLILSYTSPTAVTGMTLTQLTTTSFQVSWTGSVGATSYTYYLNGTATTPSTDNGVASKTVIFTGLTAGSRYSFYFKATNINGSIWSVNVPTSAYFGTSCLVWLDAADQSTVTQTSNNISKWTDKSTNAYQFTPPTGTATYTTLSGTAKPINEITLSGTSYLYCSTCVIPSTYSMFIFGNDSGNGYNRVVSANVDQYIYVGTGSGNTNFTLNIGNGTWQNPSSSANISIASPSVFGLTTNNTTTGLYGYANGNTVYNGVTGINASFTGFRVAYNGVGFDGGTAVGSQGEVVVFNSVLTTTQRQYLEGYMAWKFGSQESLVSGHPYAISPPLGMVVSMPPVTINSVSYNSSVISSSNFSSNGILNGTSTTNGVGYNCYALLNTTYGYTFSITPNVASTIYILAVGGGGGGGSYVGGGGGGGAALFSSISLTAGQTQNITINIGAGGTAVTGKVAGNIGSSTTVNFSVSTGNNITAVGGGGGGNGGNPINNGTNGACGGGAGWSGGTAGTGTVGYNGATGNIGVTGGGGGGMGSAGATNSVGGAGIQIPSTLYGVKDFTPTGYNALSTYYWCGGGGGVASSSMTNGGSGGGGAGGATGSFVGTSGSGGFSSGSVVSAGVAGNGAPNTGSGGGGGYTTGGGGGGSGIVIIAFKN